MLITPNGPVLDVRRISRHLGVRDWSVARELKLGAEGHPGRLRGDKVPGAGRVGQGGQWQVKIDDYLDWVGVPAEDRPVLGDDGLPRLHPFDRVASEEGLTLDQLKAFVDASGLDYLRVFRRRYLSHHQRARVQNLLRGRAATSG